MNDDEKVKIYNDGFKTRQDHNGMSPETAQELALMAQNFTNIEKKLDCLILKVDELTEKTLFKIDANKEYATKLELEKIKSKVNFYAWVVPICTAVIGFLVSKLI